MLAIGVETGVFEEYRYTTLWYRVQFPDSSYAIVPGAERTMLHDSIIESAYHAWGDRVFRRLARQSKQVRHDLE